MSISGSGDEPEGEGPLSEHGASPESTEDLQWVGRDAETDSESVAGFGDEPPVIARMVVEIRSDGSRTIARGAMEDHLQGERVQVEARADSPLQLATALAKLLFESPRLARRALEQSRHGEPVLNLGDRREGRGLRKSLRRALRRRILGDGD